MSETSNAGAGVSRPVSAAQLRQEADRAAAIAAELSRQASAAALAEEAARRPQMPSVEEGPAYVAFTRYMSGRDYAYAAVGWRVGRSVRWAITSASGGRSERFNWPALLAFVGEENWATLRTLTPGDRLLPEGFEPPVVETMGQYGRVSSTRRVVGSRYGDPDPYLG